MSARSGIFLATGLLLLAALLRIAALGTLPPGFHEDELIVLRLTETARAGQLVVFYDLAPLGGQGGHEALFPALLAVSTAFIGGGLLGYRALPLFLGMLTLACVFALARRLYGLLAGLAALALLSLGMWPILLGRSVLATTLLPLLSAATMLTLSRVLPDKPRPPRSEPGTIPLALLGLLLGLGFYAHPMQFWLLLGVLAFLYWMARAPQRLPASEHFHLLFALGILVIVLLPYALSSVVLDELNSIGRMLGDYDARRNPPLQAILGGLAGIFFLGDASPLRNLPGRPLLDLFSGLLVLSGLLAMWQGRRQPRFAMPLIMLAVLLPPALLSGESPDFGRMAPLLPVLALCFGLGAITLINSVPRHARLAQALLLLALPAFNLLWVSNDLFRVWPRDAETQHAWNGRLGQLANHIDISASDLPTLICVPAISELAPGPQLRDATRLLLMQHWRSEEIRYANCDNSLVLANGGARQQVILPRENLLAGVHPFLLDWLRTGKAPADANLPPESVIALDVAERLGDRIGSFTTTAPVRLAPEAPGGAEITLPPLPFGGNMTFLGYELAEGRVFRGGDILTSITWWRVDGPLPADLHLFTHIMSDPAAIAAQTDRLDVLAANLHPRDIFVQVTQVTLPEALPAGEYLVSVGAYQQGDDRRLAVLQDGIERGTRIFLAANGFTVEEGG